MAQNFVAATVLNIDDIKNQLRKASKTINLFRSNIDTVPFRDRVVRVSDQNLGNHFSLDHPDNGIIDSPVLELDTGLGELVPTRLLWVGNTVKEFLYLSDFIDTDNTTATIDYVGAEASTPATTLYYAEFNGSSGVVDLNHETDTADRSISFWIKPENITTSGYSVITNDNTSLVNGYLYVSCLTESSVNKLWVRQGDSTGQKVTITEGSWNHVVINRDSSNNYQEIYIDGVTKGTAAIGTTKSGSGNTTTYLGADRLGAGTLFDGRVADLRIWSGGILSSVTVGEIYNSGVPNNTSKEVSSTASLGTYAFEGDSTDSVGSNDGTDTNMQWRGNVENNIGVSFNGTNAQIDFTNSLIGNTAPANWSIAFWVNVGRIPTTTSEPIFNEARSGGSANRVGVWVQTDGTLVCGGYTTSDQTLGTTSTALTKNTWYHYMITYDGTDYKTYLNNTLEDTQTLGALTTGNNTAAMGVRDYSGTYFFRGKLADFRVVASEFTSAQRSALYNGGVINHQQSVGSETSWFKFDHYFTDSGSNGYDGTPTSVITPRSGLFNGTSSYIDIGNYYNFGSGDFSISAWFKPKTTPSGAVIIAKYWGVSAERGWNLSINGSQQPVFTSSPDGSATSLYTSSQTTTNNEWMHVVFTKTGTTGKLYIDGVEDTSATGSVVGTIYSTSNQVCIGAQRKGDGTHGAYFDGEIDDVRIWSGTALSSAQVTALYNGGAGTDETVSTESSWWKIDGTAIDFGSNGYDGTASGLAYFGVNPRLKGTLGAFFDGATSYITIPDAVGDITGPMSISCWVNHAATDSQQTYVARMNGTASTNQYTLEYNTNKVQFVIGNTGGTSYTASKNWTMETGYWHHVVATFNGTTMKIYHDGVVGTSDTFSGTQATTAVTTAVGAKDVTGTPTAWLEAQMEDLRFFDYELSADNVSDLYNISSKTAGLSASESHWYYFDEGDSTDSVAAANGTDSNMTYGSEVTLGESADFDANIKFSAGDTFRSNVLTKGINTITDATFLTAGNIEGTGTFTYYLSADEGVNWEEVTIGQLHTFTKKGSGLKYRIDVSNANATINILDNVNKAEPISVSYIND